MCLGEVPTKRGLEKASGVGTVDTHKAFQGGEETTKEFLMISGAEL